MAEQTNAAGGQQQAPGQTFNIAKIFLKDASFESPNTPQVFQGTTWNPQVHVDLGTDARAVANNTYEVVLSVTVTAKLGEQTAYLCEIKQGGIFQLDGFDQPTLRGILGSYCPNILFPYAREAITDLVTKGGFPQLVLGPVNFDALYAQQQAQQNAQAGAADQH